jgi:hypothetical protein
MEVLRNPKYTGYQVFNRRARRSGHGKVNNPVKWVWSPEPVHEPLIPKWLYDELAARRHAHRGSRDGTDPNSHPSTQRTYLLRGRVRCACGRRMLGHHHANGYAYYRCYPAGNNRGRPDKHAGHPKTIYLREDALLDAITEFYTERLFGPDRAALLAADIADTDHHATHALAAERAKLERQLTDITRRQDSLLRQAQTADPDDPFSRALRASYNELDANKNTTLALIADLDARVAEHPDPPGADTAALIDELSQLTLRLRDAPQPLLANLFQVTQLTVQHHDDNRATITATLPAHDVDNIAHAAHHIRQSNSGPTSQNPGVNAVRAPGATRTHTGRILRASGELALTCDEPLTRRRWTAYRPWRYEAGACPAWAGIEGARRRARWLDSPPHLQTVQGTITQAANDRGAGSRQPSVFVRG